MRLMDVYAHMPIAVQNMAFSAAGWNIQRTRYGAGFHAALDELESHADWSKDRLLAWRDDRMRDLVKHAYETVPYYHDIMDEGGIDPASIRTAEDLKALPVLTKDMVKAQPERFLSSEAKNLNLTHVHTSGTTGSGFQFESTIECRQWQFACFWRYYRQHGLSFDTWQAQFSSNRVVPLRALEPPFWRIDNPGKRYYMSAFHESPANLPSYYEIINKKRFEWISGYPSLMVLLAHWMNERGLRFDFVRAVTCGAENLLEHQADAMERAFGVRPVQTYGQTENVAIFSQQPDGRILVDEDFSVVEFEPLPSGGGSAFSALAFSITRRRSSVIGRETSFGSGAHRAHAARSCPSTAGRKTTSACRTVRGSGSSITFSRTPRILRRRRSTRTRTIPSSCGLWESRTCA